MRKLSSFLLTVVLVISSSVVFAQQSAVFSGRVLDENGEPLPGANVFIDASALGALKTHGSAADKDGNYAFPVAAKYANGQEVDLQVRYIGYKTAISKVTVRVGTITTNFNMVLDNLMLDEIIVTGVISGTTKKKLAFSVAKVNKEQLEMAPATNMGAALSGKVAGVKAQMNTGKPGDGVNILLRGATSISGSNAPLIIVDGVILSASMRDLSALDILDMQIVKGAAASSLYGSRAANGVINITTDRGANLGMNTTKITVRNEYGFSQIPSFDDPVAGHHEYKANATDWLDSNGAVVEYGGQALDVTSFGDNTAVFTDNVYPISSTNGLYDNVDLFFEPGSYNVNSASVGQNLGATNWKASFANYHETGLVDALDGYTRKNVRLNLDHEIKEGLTIGLSGSYTQSTRDDPQGPGGNPFYSMMFMAPNANLLAPNADGTPYNIQADPLALEENPLYLINNREEEDKRNRAMGSISVRYTPVTWANIEGNFSYDRSDRVSSSYRHVGFKSVENQDPGHVGSFSLNNAVDQAVNSSLTASVTHSFGDFNTRWKFRYLNERTTTNSFSVTGSDLVVNNVRDLSTVVGSKSIGSGSTEVISNGFFFITGWDYKDKYIGDVLVRWDGSSLFGPDERWNNYFRASAAYRLSEESWFNFDSINEFKLRASYGTAGNRPRFSAQYETYGVSGGIVAPANLGNKNLKPELSTEVELGLDFSLFDKLGFELTYAATTTEDQILRVPLPGFFGFENQWQNAGTMESKAFEASVNYSVISTRDFSWNTRFLMDRTRQKITDFDLPAYRTQGSFYIRDNEDYGTMYGDHWITSTSELSADAQPYADQYQVNDDGLLVWVGSGNSYTDGFAKNLWGSSSTETGHGFGRPIKGTDASGSNFLRLGRATPDFSWSFSNDIRWKGITAYMLFDAQVGGIIYNNTRGYPYRDNRGAETDQFGKADGAKKSRTYYQDLYNVNATSEWFVEDGTFVKLREVTVRYSFKNSQLVSGLGDTFGGWMDRLTVGVIGRNLWTITDYKGFDPEVGGSSIFRVDSFSYPNTRNFTGFIEIEF